MNAGRLPARVRWRRLELGLRTLFGAHAGGFFIPYRHASAVTPVAYPGLQPIFDQARPQFDAVLDAIESYSSELDRIVRGDPGLLGARPARFDQTWFPRTDAAAAYAMIRRSRPARIVEIGSGHSSRFMAQAIADGDLATNFLCIDPQPRAPLAGLPLRHEARLFGTGDAEPMEALRSGDILFVDSSHIGMPGTDVDTIVLDVLPRLAPGVIVHFHDIFLPDPYPQEFGWRGYNEHLAVGALLVGRGFEPLFSSHVARARAGAWLARQPLPHGAYESSLWLRKCE